MKKIKSIIMALSITLIASAYAEEAPRPNKQYLRLKCGGSVELPHQPCGGFNASQMTINLDGTKGAFKEFSSYGGCYRVSGTSFGSINSGSITGEIISLNFVREGDMRNGMPYVDDFKFESTAKLNLKTKTLHIIHDQDQEFYFRPTVLKCVER